MRRIPLTSTTVTLVIAAAVLGACSPDRDIDTGPSSTIALAGPASPASSLAADAAETGSAAPAAEPLESTPPSSTARPTPSATRPTATPHRPFAMDLSSRSDFVAQYTFEWCVGASLQMALNMATDATRTSRADQKGLWEMARDRSSSPFGGANPRGWTAALNDLGIGPYELVSLPTFDDAVATAAAAIRGTRRPVGLVMWRGRHAWVMSGFQSTGDPRNGDYRVTGVRVHDPLYPHGSSTWGRSPRPGSLISLATLARQYVIREHGRVDLGVPPGYLLVLPVSDAA
jgi:hypothetical protein